MTVNYDMVYGNGAMREGAAEAQEEMKAPPPATARAISRRELEAKKTKEERGPSRSSLVDGNFVFYPENIEPNAIRGWRAVAFDYSGKSGSPCLMAMVDKVEGGKRKEWVWQAPASDDKSAKGPEVKIRIEGRSFILDYGDANMRGTFLAPSKVNLSHRTDPGSIMMKGADGMRAEPFERNQILARGEAGTEGLFIMVATFQTDTPAPEVTVEGEGLASVITVGGRKIRIVGDHLVIGD